MDDYVPKMDILLDQNGLKEIKIGLELTILSWCVICTF